MLSLRAPLQERRTPQASSSVVLSVELGAARERHRAPIRFRPNKFARATPAIRAPPFAKSLTKGLAPASVRPLLSTARKTIATSDPQTLKRPGTIAATLR